MTIQSNKDLAQKFFDAFNRHDINGILTCVDRDVEWFSAGQTYRGQDALRGAVQDWFTAFPDCKNEITSLVADDNRVFVEYISRGVHKGLLPLPSGEIMPAGGRVELHVCDMYLIRNGKIVVGHNYYDTGELISQLEERPMTRQAGA